MATDDMCRNKGNYEGITFYDLCDENSKLVKVVGRIINERLLSVSRTVASIGLHGISL